MIDILSMAQDPSHAHPAQHLSGPRNRTFSHTVRRSAGGKVVMRFINCLLACLGWNLHFRLRARYEDGSGPGKGAGPRHPPLQSAAFLGARALPADTPVGVAGECNGLPLEIAVPITG